MIKEELPSSVEVEASILGCMLLYIDKCVSVFTMLQPRDFYEPKHKTIYTVMLSMFSNGIAIDSITVADSLTLTGQIESIGGAFFLSDLTMKAPTSAANIDHYCRIVKERAIRRDIISFADEIRDRAISEEEDGIAILDQIQGQIFDISRVDEQSAENSKVLLQNELAAIEMKMAHTYSPDSLPIGYYDLEKITGALEPKDLIIIAGRPSTGKCQPYYTVIDCPTTGERLTIQEYVCRRERSISNISINGNMQITDVSDWIDNGIRPCYRIRTKLGRSVDATNNHPFLTVDGWRPMGELSVGGHIAVPTSLPIFGKDDSWDLGLVRLLGYFIADGGLTGGTPMFTKVDVGIVEDFKNTIGRIFPDCGITQSGITYRVSRRKDGVIVDAKNPVTAWLKEHGMMGKLSKHKHFPDCVWKFDRRHMAEFLKALISCDGCIYKGVAGPQIEFGVASELLANDVYHALLRFGILAKVYYKRATCEGKKFDSWRVELSNPIDIGKYQEEIGWVGEKANKFTGHIFKSGAHGRNNGHAPKEIWPILKGKVKEAGISFVEMARRAGETTAHGHSSGFNPHAKRGLPLNRLAKYAEVLDDNQLRFISSTDIYWDEIVSIEPIGKHRVFDLTVPDGNNFVAQDIYVHNSSLALCMAWNIIQTAPVVFFSVEMSKERLATRLLALRSGIPLQILYNPKTASNADIQKMRESVASIEPYAENLVLDDTASVSLSILRAKVKQFKSEMKVKCIILDYLGIMDLGNGKESQEQKVGTLVRGIKLLAKQEGVCFILLAQLNREVEARKDKKPILSDLRSSGEIEQTADMVILIHRPELYGMTEGKDGEPGEGEVEIIVAKNRNGAVGSVKMAFIKETTNFRPLYIPAVQQPRFYGEQTENETADKPF